MLESLLLNEGAIGRDEAELLGRALTDKFTVIIGQRGFFTSRLLFELIFRFFLDIWYGIGSLLNDLESEITL